MDDNFQSLELIAAHFSTHWKYSACRRLSQKMITLPFLGRKVDAKLQAIRAAAEANDPLAQVVLGLKYYDGKGVPQSFQNAMEWFRRAADQGYAMAQYNIGWMYATGEGVQQNFQTAVSWYLKASKQGFAKAQFYLAKACVDGRGIEQSYHDAIEWFKKAEQNGYAEALLELAEMNAKGLGVSRDYDTALSCIKKASAYPELLEKAKAAERSITEERDRAEREHQREEEAKQRQRSSQSRAKKDEKYYGKILGLKGEVSKADVKRRYRELVSQYHPDKVNHLGPKLRELAEKEMKEINEAYAYFKREYGIV